MAVAARLNIPRLIFIASSPFCLGRHGRTASNIAHYVVAEIILSRVQCDQVSKVAEPAVIGRARAPRNLRALALHEIVRELRRTSWMAMLRAHGWLIVS
jgi:hypothetical protein